jgi:hypothetical protein
MKRSIIASFAALSMLATPALAATAPAAKPTKASLMQKKKAKVAGAKLTKAAAKTSNETKSN